MKLVWKLHKWIALVVGLQVLGWVLGGLIMTVLPIEKVRGEHRLSHRAPPALNLKSILPVAEAARRADLGEISSATLKSTPRGPVWELSMEGGGEAWYDAITGENVDEIPERLAKQAAVAAYSGPGRPIRVSYVPDVPIKTGASGSAYLVEFDDPERTRFYMSSFTGELISQRSNLWSFYNFFYEIHVLDFSGSQNYNHPIIVSAAALTLMIVLTGFIMLWIRLAGDLRSVRSRRLLKE